METFWSRLHARPLPPSSPIPGLRSCQALSLGWPADYLTQDAGQGIGLCLMILQGDRRGRGVTSSGLQFRIFTPPQGEEWAKGSPRDRGEATGPGRGTARPGGGRRKEIGPSEAEWGTGLGGGGGLCVEGRPVMSGLSQAVAVAPWREEKAGRAGAGAERRR